MFGKKRTLSIILAVALMASMLLTACTQTSTNTGESNSKYVGTSEKGTAVINISTEPAEMCSITTTDTVSFSVLRHIVEGLTILDQEDKPVAGVAKDWTISDDQLVYTFNLRDDYKWSNGEKVTAKDFEFAFKSLIDPNFASDYAYFGYVFKNATAFAGGKAKIEDVGIKVIDDYKLELTLEQPTPYLLDMLAFGVFLPVNQKAYDAVGDKYGTDVDKIVTNGPYTMESWEHENQIVLKKNADYPNAKDIKVEKIVMKMIKDTNTGLNSFKANEIDMTILNGDQAASMKAESYPVNTYDDGSSWYFEYNLKNPTLANLKVRQALTYAIDSESFVKNVVKNNSLAAAQFTPPAINGNKDKFAKELGPQYKSHDLETAKKLIEEAKKELGVDNITVSMLIDDTDTATKHAAFFQESWKSELGITVDVEAVPFKSRIQRMSDKDFQIVLGGWGPDYNDPMTFLDMFETGNGNNHTSYTSAEYDALLAKARVELDRDKRFGYLMDMETLLMKDMPIGPYYFRARDYVTSEKLSGVVRTAFQDINLRWAEVK